MAVTKSSVASTRTSIFKYQTIQPGKNAFSRALEHNPDAPELLNALGATYIYSGLPKKAKPLFEAALATNPACAECLFNLGLIYIAEQDLPKAQETFYHFLTLRPGNARALKELAYIDAANGRYHQALNALNDAILNDPNWPILYFELAAIYMAPQQPKRRTQYTRKSHPLNNPSNHLSRIQKRNISAPMEHQTRKRTRKKTRTIHSQTG